MGTRRCILLLVDGLRPDVAEAELERGMLPNLAAMIRNGSIGRAVTAFPSTTSVSYLPFLTGCTPGRCNVPSIRWLDRERYRGRWWRDRDALRSYCGYQAGRLDADIAPNVRTIFELVPESVGIFTMITRGLTPERDPARRERKFWGAVAHYTEWHQPSDEAVARHLLHEIRRPWRFVFAQFPAVDGYTHQSAPDAPRVLRALRRVDEIVGKLRATLLRLGQLDDTLILVVSDHGASPVHTHLDLADWFRARGVPTLSHPVVWTRAPRAAVMVAGNGSAMVYARPGRPRRDRWPLQRLRQPDGFGSDQDLVEALVREPAVALVAGESGSGGVSVLSRDGEAELARSGDRIRYRPLRGDPLGMGGTYEATAREWLEASADGPYPDAAWNLLDQFRSPRTGDLLVVAREGYDFRDRFEIPEHRSGHGSLIRRHMQVPVWSSHPAPPVPLRTADLFPAMLHWLGVEVPAGVDGEPVWLPGAGTERRVALAAPVAQAGPSRFFSGLQGRMGP
ncbi:MAG TPA: alkaline phosphatase family protein [Gemmatimonadales bacterium]|nr:alkaline phosphatase family protein [Gemmatimonadales bacterium]